MKFLTGFESTQIFGSGKDVLQTTRHTDFFEQDLQLVRSCNIDFLRYSAPWHSIEKEPGVYDWRWMDAALDCVQKYGITPILDPLHHTSFPVWLEDGFANPYFPDRYFDFVWALANRYPWIKHYTIFNEPFVTVFFCGHEGIWYPYKRGGDNFVRMILNAGSAICRISKMLTESVADVRLIHVDTCETHRAKSEQAAAAAAFRNELRFLVHDLILGNINQNHSLYYYLRHHGATEEQIGWFAENPARIDVLGLDYYSHSELEWSAPKKLDFPARNPIGFARVAMDYVNRFNLPVMLSETNIRGTVLDRVSWLKFMVEQAEQLEAILAKRGTKFHGFCWYPFINSTDWCSLVRKARGRVDPQGIFCLDDNCVERRESELSRTFAALAAGEIGSKEIPAYSFSPPTRKMLRGFLPLMNHWQWQQPFD